MVLAFPVLKDKNDNLVPLSDLILNKFEGPEDDNKNTQFLITNIDYDPYVGHCR